MDHPEEPSRVIDLSVCEEDKRHLRALQDSEPGPGHSEDLAVSAASPVLSADGRFILTPCHSGHNVLALHRATSREIRTPSPHKDTVTCLATMGTTGDFLTGSVDHTMRLWSCDGHDIAQKDNMVWEGPVTHIAAHPSLKIIAVCLENKLIKLRHLNNKSVDEVRIELQDSKLTFLLLNENQLIYGTDLGKVFVWNYEDQENPVFMLFGHVNVIRLLCLSEHRLASYAHNDSTICVWNVTAGKLKYRIETDRRQYTALELDGPNHMLFLASQDREFHMYCTRSRRHVTSEPLATRASLIRVGEHSPLLPW